ncbi:hypothetical protein HELRODRAFT_182729 [Helobdella robusta]|uniref:Uncharacterized protein n=1 Tax=Helobdella robusta TaxID=6412 RepID=T1FIN4_HELRO|nr:hypothetical protein HELRODRAFT_182729 [Helobdella robusta]ESN90229.1 hypothetical protein HELRODRAFT_182729 [Helobdella robusta]
MKNGKIGSLKTVVTKNILVSLDIENFEQQLMKQEFQTITTVLTGGHQQLLLPNRRFFNKMMTYNRTSASEGFHKTFVSPWRLNIVIADINVYDQIDEFPSAATPAESVYCRHHCQSALPLHFFSIDRYSQQCNQRLMKSKSFGACNCNATRGHTRKLNRKKALALRANKIKKRPRRLPMARGTEPTKTWRDSKRNNAGFKSKDLVWLCSATYGAEKEDVRRNSHGTGKIAARSLTW